MAITGSGEIKLIGDVNNEINGNTTDTNVSLTTLSTEAGKSAPHGLTEFYGYVDAVAPTIATSTTINNLTNTTFCAGFSLTNDGGEPCSVGLYLGTNSNYASNTKSTIWSSQTTGASSQNCWSGQSPGTTYYVTAFAINSVGESVGSTVSFTTTYPTPTAWRGGLIKNNSQTGSWGDYMTTYAYYNTLVGWQYTTHCDWWTGNQWKSSLAAYQGVNQNKFYSWATSSYQYQLLGSPGVSNMNGGSISSCGCSSGGCQSGYSCTSCYSTRFDINLQANSCNGQAWVQGTWTQS